jgi:hypothetical protein
MLAAEPDGRRPPTSASEGRAKRALESGSGSRRYPGTGWGRRVDDRAVVVAFEPHRSAAESLVLRYEYRDGLAALGVLPGQWRRDRLWDRDRGAEGKGFAKPPHH